VLLWPSSSIYRRGRFVCRRSAERARRFIARIFCGGCLVAAGLVLLVWRVARRGRRVRLVTSPCTLGGAASGQCSKTRRWAKAGLVFGKPFSATTERSTQDDLPRVLPCRESDSGGSPIRATAGVESGGVGRGADGGTGRFFIYSLFGLWSFQNSSHNIFSKDSTSFNIVHDNS
jgi:hypothetical protein